MSAVFAAAGFDGRAAAVAADDLRRGDVALRHRPPRHALRPGDPRRLRARCAARSSRSSRACCAGGGVVRAINAGARELSRSELDGLNDVVRDPRREGRRADLRRRRRRLGGHLAKFFSAEQIAAVNAELEARPTATCCCSSPTRPHVAAASLGGLRAGARPALRPDPRGRHDVLWIVDFPMFEYDERAERRAGPRSTTRSPRPPATSTTRRACSRAPTTSSSTASRSAAARSASTTPRSSSGSSTLLGLDADEARSGSASCSTRCATAPRRTAGSRWASTAS